ncbi:MAG: ATP-binding cassette domain-containing protein, partial [Erysipelotrichaceae bacterium]|nr:ATP-binding cassette domain-containing protein [Erysipelotrichaceae bacterium]
IEKFAARVNMSDFLNSEPTKLSGGQKQRVAIAAVLAMKLNIIVFDEATSMLDPSGKRDINRLIKQLHKEREITIISITHDIEEVAQSDNVIVVENGRIAMTGTPKEIFRNEKVMVKMQLDIPFVYKVRKELQKKGIRVSDTLSMERMAEEICQSVLKN